MGSVTISESVRKVQTPNSITSVLLKTRFRSGFRPEKAEENSPNFVTYLLLLKMRSRGYKPGRNDGFLTYSSIWWLSLIRDKRRKDRLYVCMYMFWFISLLLLNISRKSPRVGWK